ncbi:MAG: hypothetical protein IJJ33_20455 [Victivallales bacterium]|nr:hypothetical protein [Victivallales bacterium]
MSWLQIEKQIAAYKRRPDLKSAAALDKVLKSSAPFLEKLAEYCIVKHEPLQKDGVAFQFSENGQYPEWCCSFDSEHNLFVINVLGIDSFYLFCQQATQEILSPELTRTEKRWRCFCRELAKLPRNLFVLLLLFQEEARVMQITEPVRRRREELSQADLDYFHILWAVQELETVYRQLTGNSLRRDTQFTWFESEWL